MNKENQTPSMPISSNKRGLAVGATVMVLTQIVMVAIMTMTPVHMKHHGHGLAEVGIVIGFHVGAMYLPSLVTGILVDKIGRTAMSIASGITLLLAGVVAAFAPSDSMVLLIVALSLLGLGWNFGLISGTAQIVDATEPSTRAKHRGRWMFCGIGRCIRWCAIRYGSGEFKLCSVVLSRRAIVVSIDSCCHLV